MQLNDSEERRSSERLRWNDKYVRNGLECYGGEPVLWLRQCEKLLIEQPKGPALDLACGNGRNAFYLAKLGFRVEAVDISDVAIAWLRDRVREEGVPVFPRVMDLEDACLAESEYEVILNFNYLQRSLFAGIEKALRPGGLLLFETMTRDHIEILGDKIDPRFVLDPDELLGAFSDLRILNYREQIVTQGDGRQKSVASLVARKVG